MKLQSAKGTKDYLPQDMISFQFIMDELRKTFELFGFSPLTSPVIERFDLLSAKYTGGSEILKETFKFKDQGNRELGLRYDLTVPFARIIGQNPQLKFPFKRYQMEKVYRDGPVGPGRYREFWQCDVDIVGSKSMKAEAELLKIADSFFTSIKLKPVIGINNIKILTGILDKLGVKNKEEVILILDKFFKLSKKQLYEEMQRAGVRNGEEIVDTFLSLTGTTGEKLEKISTFIGESKGVTELRELLDFCKMYSIQNIEFQPMLARGLSYYTGTIFEVMLKDNAITSSVCAGGRYDSLIQNLLASKNCFPCVGLSFGVSRIYDALIDAKLIENKKTVTRVLIIPINQEKQGIRIVQKVRESGLNAEIDINGRGMSKNLQYANSLGIPFALIIGETEIKKKIVLLKNLQDGDQEELSLAKAISKIKSLV